MVVVVMLYVKVTTNNVCHNAKVFTDRHTHTHTLATEKKRHWDSRDMGVSDIQMRKGISHYGPLYVLFVTHTHTHTHTHVYTSEKREVSETVEDVV